MTLWGICLLFFKFWRRTFKNGFKNVCKKVENSHYKNYKISDDFLQGKEFA